MDLILDEEFERLAALRGRRSAEAFLILELREARSKGEHVCAYRDAKGRYSVRVPRHASGRSGASTPPTTPAPQALGRLLAGRTSAPPKGAA